MASSPVSAAAILTAELVALERSAAVASAHLCRHRAELADHTKPFVQRYAEADVEPLTWFHSREAPDSALIAVFASMAKRIRTFDATTGRAAVVLMRRYSDHTGLAITTFMVHRLFLTALVVASKAHHDHVVRNQDVAKIFGIHRRELNRLEAAFCIGIGWRAQVSNEDLQTPAPAFASVSAPKAAVARDEGVSPTRDFASSIRSATGSDAGATTTPTNLHATAARSVGGSSYVPPYALSLSFGATASDGDEGVSPSSRLTTAAGASMPS